MKSGKGEGERRMDVIKCFGKRVSRYQNRKLIYSFIIDMVQMYPEKNIIFSSRTECSKMNHHWLKNLPFEYRLN